MKPPHGDPHRPPISEATLARVKRTWPRRRHSGDVYRSEFESKAAARREARDPANRVAKGIETLLAGMITMRIRIDMGSRSQSQSSAPGRHAA